MEQLRRWHLQIHAKHSRQARGGFLGVRILTTMTPQSTAEAPGSLME